MLTHNSEGKRAITFGNPPPISPFNFINEEEKNTKREKRTKPKPSYVVCVKLKSPYEQLYGTMPQYMFQSTGFSISNIFLIYDHMQSRSLLLFLPLTLLTLFLLIIGFTASECFSPTSQCVLHHLMFLARDCDSS